MCTAVLLEDLKDQRALQRYANFVDHLFDLLSIENAALIAIDAAQFTSEQIEIDRAVVLELFQVLFQQ